MKKIDMVIWWCMGVLSHDLVSVYAPDGGHIPGWHAFYYIVPLLIIALAWKETIGKRKATAPPTPSAQQNKSRVYN